MDREDAASFATCIVFSFCIYVMKSGLSAMFTQVRCMMLQISCSFFHTIVSKICCIVFQVNDRFTICLA